MPTYDFKADHNTIITRYNFFLPFRGLFFLRPVVKLNPPSILIIENFSVSFCFLWFLIREFSIHTIQQFKNQSLVIKTIKYKHQSL